MLPLLYLSVNIKLKRFSTMLNLIGLLPEFSKKHKKYGFSTMLNLIGLLLKTNFCNG